MRLIDADDLKKAVSESYCDLLRGKALEFGCEGIMAGLAMTSALIDSAETVDTTPVQKGHWESVYRNGVEWTIRCSECHMIGFTNRARYCHYCGAKMEADDEAD